MSDLVQRLRAEIDEDVNEPMDRLLEDAAAENERLFEENGKLANTLGAENLQLRAEVERQAARMKTMDEENERLRAALKEIITRDRYGEFAAIASEALNGTAEG
jgi:hypothetical protein